MRLLPSQCSSARRASVAGALVLIAALACHAEAAIRSQGSAQVQPAPAKETKGSAARSAPQQQVPSQQQPTTTLATSVGGPEAASPAPGANETAEARSERPAGAAASTSPSPSAEPTQAPANSSQSSPAPSSLSLSLDEMLVNSRPRALQNASAAAPGTADRKARSQANPARQVPGEVKSGARRTGQPAGRQPVAGPSPSSKRNQEKTSRLKAAQRQQPQPQPQPQPSAAQLDEEQAGGSAAGVAGGQEGANLIDGLDLMRNLLDSQQPQQQQQQQQQQAQQAQQQLFSRNGQPDDMVMSVMSSADGKERRLVMISRDTLDSLQRMAAAQQEEQQQQQQQQQQQLQLQVQANASTAAPPSSTDSSQMIDENWSFSPSTVTPDGQQTLSSSANASTAASGSSVADASGASRATTPATADSGPSSASSPRAPQSSSPSSADESFREVPVATGNQPPEPEQQAKSASGGGGGASTPVAQTGQQQQQQRALDEAAGSSAPASSAASVATTRQQPSAREGPVPGALKTGARNGGKKGPKQSGKPTGKSPKSRNKSARVNASAGRPEPAPVQPTLAPASAGPSLGAHKVAGQPTLAAGAEPQPLQRGQLRQEEPRLSPASVADLDMDERQLSAWQMGVGSGQRSREPAKLDELDELDSLRQAFPGEPRADYPIHATPPKSSFSCASQTCHGGYYADLESQCQAFHICHQDGRSDTFLCPNGTIFSQQHLVCVWWWQVDCQQSTSLYKLNDAIYCNSPAVASPSSSSSSSSSSPLATVRAGSESSANSFARRMQLGSSDPSGLDEARDDSRSGADTSSDNNGFHTSGGPSRLAVGGAPTLGQENHKSISANGEPDFQEQPQQELVILRA